jgi:S-adenosylmethionine-dependent methyltransferase
MKIKQRGKYDYNFDIFADKFEKSIYNTFKGEWRLKLLKEDLEELYDSKRKLDIFDAGCGFGQLSLWLASKGHNLICCDISYKMLEKAKQNFKKENVEAIFYQKKAQDLIFDIKKQDLILFHAVIEWLANPLESLSKIAKGVKKDGYLSILFFNYNSIVYKNILKGEWRFDIILDKKWYGRGKRLTPPYPQKPYEIRQWLIKNGFSIEKQTAIRVFYDYMEQDVIEKSDMEKLIELEYLHSRAETFKDMGRYIHILAKKS